MTRMRNSSLSFWFIAPYLRSGRLLPKDASWAVGQTLFPLITQLWLEAPCEETRDNGWNCWAVFGRRQIPMDQALRPIAPLPSMLIHLKIRWCGTVVHHPLLHLSVIWSFFGSTGWAWAALCSGGLKEHEVSWQPPEPWPSCARPALPWDQTLHGATQLIPAGLSLASSSFGALRPVSRDRAVLELQLQSFLSVAPLCSPSDEFLCLNYSPAADLTCVLVSESVCGIDG